MGRVKEAFVRGIDIIDDRDSSCTPLSKLCDIADWNCPEFNSLACDIFDLGQSKSAMLHRKLWEFTACVKALKNEGMLTEESVGLSVAAGHERVLYYLARKVGRIVATDIYGQSSFSNLEACTDAIACPEKFAPYEYPKDRLKVLFMDAFALQFPSSLFDFCICLSSIEHFGGFDKACTSIREMGRVVRRGGLVIISTECSLNGKTTDEVFTTKEIR